jgi:hypothetical protein
MKMNKTILACAATLALSSLVSAAAPSASVGSWSTQTSQSICLIIDNLRGLLQMIAGAIATLVIVINGIKWTGSSDDPGARKQAKQGIIHAIVGLIIVMIAVNVVALIYSGGCSV